MAQNGTNIATFQGKEKNFLTSKYINEKCVTLKKKNFCASLKLFCRNEKWRSTLVPEFAAPKLVRRFSNLHQKKRKLISL